MCNRKDGYVLLPAKEINSTDTEIKTEGFGVGRTSDTFCHKEDQHVLAERIAQKVMLKRMTAHAWARMLLCYFCIVLVSCFSHCAQANKRFTPPNLAQWSHMSPFSTVKALVQ